MNNLDHEYFANNILINNFFSSVLLPLFDTHIIPFLILALIAAIREFLINLEQHFTYFLFLTFAFAYSLRSFHVHYMYISHNCKCMFRLFYNSNITGPLILLVLFYFSRGSFWHKSSQFHSILRSSFMLWYQSCFNSLRIPNLFLLQILYHLFFPTIHLHVALTYPILDWF